MDLIRHANKYLLNPLMLRFVAQHGPFAIIHHVGRRSHKQYRTPIIAVAYQEGFLVALTYGEDVDWYHNVLAEKGCILEKHRKKYHITRLEPIDDIQMYKAFPGPLNRILKLKNITHYVLMEYK